MFALCWRRMVLCGCIFVLLVSGCSAVTPMPATQPPIPITGPVGTVQRVNDILEQGKTLGQLAIVAEKNRLDSGDILKVSGGGEGLLDFGEYLRLRLFNDTQMQAVRLERAENLPIFARVRLETGGFTGTLADVGGQAVFETPNGAKITILGTSFWIIYDAQEQSLGVGNFDGTVQVEAPGVSMPVNQLHYVILRPGEEPVERPMELNQTDLENQIRALNSPVEVLRTVLVVETPTPTPSPTDTSTPTPTPTNTGTATRTGTPSPTPTPTITPSPTPACPPILRVVENANCREGPGTNWNVITSFASGTDLIPYGYARWQTLWWYVGIPNSRAACWISDSTISVIGDASCLQALSVPPTYVPTVTPSSTPLPIPETPRLSAPANGLNRSCYSTSETINLSWYPVSNPNGTIYYEWVLENLTNGTSTGNWTSNTSVDVQVNCPSYDEQYRWYVRAVEGSGMNYGAYSEAWYFSIGYTIP